MGLQACISSSESAASENLKLRLIDFAGSMIYGGQAEYKKP